MRKLGVWSVATALVLGLANSARAEDEDKKKEPSRWNIFGRYFGKNPDKELEETFEAESKKGEKEEAKRAQQEQARAERQRALAAKARADYLRRETILDNLKRLASEAGDEATLRKVEDLSDRSWAVFLKKAPPAPNGYVSDYSPSRKIEGITPAKEFTQDLGIPVTFDSMPKADSGKAKKAKRPRQGEE